jgi:hypothetical protein
MSVAAQILQHIFGAAEGTFQVHHPGSKITALVLGWVEDSVVRSDSRAFGVAEASSKYVLASIVW